MAKLKSECTPEEWQAILAKQRRWYAKRKGIALRLHRHGGNKVKLSIRLKKEVYDRIKAIANETETKTPHGAIVHAVEEYVHAWFTKQSLLDIESTQDDSQGFLLLSLLKSITEDDEQFRSILASALDAKRRYGSVSDYLRQYDDDD